MQTVTLSPQRMEKGRFPSFFSTPTATHKPGSPEIPTFSEGNTGHYSSPLPLCRGHLTQGTNPGITGLVFLMTKHHNRILCKEVSVKMKNPLGEFQVVRRCLLRNGDKENAVGSCFSHSYCFNKMLIGQ